MKEDYIMIKVPTLRDLESLSEEDLRVMAQLCSTAHARMQQFQKSKVYARYKDLHRKQQNELLAEFKNIYKYFAESVHPKVKITKIDWLDIQNKLETFDFTRREGFTLGFNEHGDPVLAVSYYGGGSTQVLVENLADAKRFYARKKRRERSQTLINGYTPL